MWGEAKRAVVVLFPVEDYPHQCGEKAPPTHVLYMMKGLPPPVWGEEKKMVELAKQYRITPTSVGRSF